MQPYSVFHLPLYQRKLCCALVCLVGRVTDVVVSLGRRLNFCTPDVTHCINSGAITLQMAKKDLSAAAWKVSCRALRVWHSHLALIPRQRVVFTESNTTPLRSTSTIRRPINLAQTTLRLGSIDATCMQAVRYKYSSLSVYRPSSPFIRPEDVGSNTANSGCRTGGAASSSTSG